MRWILLLFLTAFLCSFKIEAQDSKALLNKANSLFESEAYRQALDTYTEILMFDNVLEAKTKIAHCHRMVGEFEEAEYWYRIIIPQVSDRKLEFNLAQALQGQEKFEEAASYYSAYADVYPKSQMFANACINIDQFYINASKYKVENLPFNSPNIEFGPTLYANNQLVFTSSRSGNKKQKNSYYGTEEAFLDLYVTQPYVSTWSPPKKLSGNINSSYHDGPVTFDKYFQTAWFTRNTEVRGKGVKEQTKKLNLQLINASILDNGKWSEGDEFPFNSNDYTVAHPSLAENGKVLYFSSNMPGGYGGADIYVSVKVDTTWSYPKNLGPDINTPEDEQFPFIHPDGTLYFSSNGHPGIGGYDIYFSKSTKRHWSQPQNMGAPINSAKDDFSITFDLRTGGGYFASNRDGGVGQDDIYRFKVKGTLNYPKSIAGTTQVEDAQFASASNPNIIDGSNEIFVPAIQNEPNELPINNNNKKEKVKPEKKKTKTPKKKKPKTEKPQKPEKEVKTKQPKPEKEKKPKKPKKEKPVKNKPTKEKTPKNNKKEIIPEPIVNDFNGQVPINSLNAILNIGAIQFKGKSDLMTEQVLDQISPVIIYARENPRAKIRIESYTDSRGTERSNLDLAKNRLANIVNFFYQNGIQQTRLELVARGETGILNGCVDGSDCSVAKHRFNQRIIFTKKDRNTPKVNNKDNVLPAPADEEYIDFDANKQKDKVANKKTKTKKNKKDKTAKKPVVSNKDKANLPTPKVSPTKNIQGFTYSVEVGPYTDFSIEQKFILNSINLKQTLISVQASKKKIELNRLEKITEVEEVITYLKAQGFKKIRANVYRNGKITDYSLKDMKKIQPSNY